MGAGDIGGWASISYPLSGFTLLYRTGVSSYLFEGEDVAHFPRLGRLTIVLAWALAVGGCASLGPPRPGRNGEVITFETEGGYLCGRCESLKLIVASDGSIWVAQGHWAGTYSEEIQRPLHLPPVRVAAFRAALARYRPAADLFLTDTPPCKTFWTDQPGLHVTWDDGRTPVRLVLNYGCDPEERAAMRRDLEHAPALLGIRDLRVPVATGVASTRM